MLMRIITYNSRVPPMPRRAGLLILAIGLLVPWRAMALGSWTNVVAAPPNNNGVQQMLLLPDGTVMAQQTGSTSNWYRLTPDIHGSYINGAWTTLAPMKS